jgi:hypothetical protein
MFWDVFFPDSFVRATDPAPDLLSSSKNSKKNIDSYRFVKNDVPVPSEK